MLDTTLFYRSRASEARAVDRGVVCMRLLGPDWWLNQAAPGRWEHQVDAPTEPSHVVGSIEKKERKIGRWRHGIASWGLMIGVGCGQETSC